MLESLKTAFKAAEIDLVKEMTAGIKTFTGIAGWPENITRALSVKHNNKRFKIVIPMSVRKEVFDLEYRAETKGTLVRFGNMDKEYGKVFVILFNRRLENSK